jgi:hydroxymethylbilane synthase
VAIECRSDDASTIGALASIDHALTRHDVEVERAFLAELGSGCSLPVGGHVVDGVLRTFLANLDSGVSISDEIKLSGAVKADVNLARSAAASAHSAVS